MAFTSFFKHKHLKHPLFFRGLLPLDRSQLIANLVAGLSLAAMNIPQAMGYAKIAGMPVITGLYTLLLPLVVFAVLGSSRYLVVASDSATAAILAGGLAGLAVMGSPEYVGLAGMVALLTAGMLLLARILNLGFLADFLSRTVLIGFLTGVGFQVGIAVLNTMLKINVVGNNPVHQLFEVIVNLDRTHLPTAGLSLSIIIAVVYLQKKFPRFPGALMAVIAAVILSYVFGFSQYGMEVIGPVSGDFPHPVLPAFEKNMIMNLLPVAMSCFIMIVAQSSLTARAYGTKHHQHVDENRDLLGLSAANGAAALSGTFVVNGSPTQTAMVETSGGSSQLAHLSTACVVLFVLLFLTGPLQFLPVCVLGAIVFTIAIRLVDVAGFRDLWRKSRHEWRLALITALSVVLFGVENGILIALILSLLQHVRHSYHPSTSIEGKTPDGHWIMHHFDTGEMAEEGLAVYWFGSSLFYANSDRFATKARHLVKKFSPGLKWVVVDAGAISAIDYTSGGMIRELDDDMKRQGIRMVFVHLSRSAKKDMEQLGLNDVFGEERRFESLRDCLAAYHAAQNLPV